MTTMIERHEMQNAKCKMQTRTRASASVCILHFAFCILTIALFIVSDTHAQFGFGGGPDSEMKLVARYDKDKDGRLNRQERNAARAAVGGGQQFGFRRGFRGDSVDAAPGRKLTP